MATKKVSAKTRKPAPKKKPPAAKPATRASSAKPAARKTAPKKPAVKQAARAPKRAAAPKKAVATPKKAAAPPKAAAKKQVGSPPKAAAKKAAPKPAPAKAAAKSKGKGKQRPKASDFVKRPPHTPAVFKPTSKRPIHIVFTLEEVRELIAKRAREEAAPAPKKALVKRGKKVKGAGKAQAPQVQAPAKSTHRAASLEDILGIGQPTGQPYGPDTVPKKHQKYHRLLIELRDQVREELNMHSNDTLKRSCKEDAGDIAISVDAGTDNFDRDFALSLLSAEQETLNEIEAAIQRIYKGTYGVCEVTGKPIKAERLTAVPFTRFSLEGQREFEANARRRTNRAGAFLNEASGETISFGDDDAED